MTEQQELFSSYDEHAEARTLAKSVLESCTFTARPETPQQMQTNEAIRIAKMIDLGQYERLDQLKSIVNLELKAEKKGDQPKLF